MPPVNSTTVAHLSVTQAGRELAPRNQGQTLAGWRAAGAAAKGASYSASGLVQ